MLPQFVIDKIFQMTRGNAVITTDVGQHQMWAAQYYHCQRPNNWIISGGLGTMGYGLPGRDRRAGGAPGRARGLRRRRRLVPDEHPGDGHGRGGAPPGQGRASSTTATSAWSGSGSSTSTTTASRRSTCTSQPDFVKLAEAFGALGLRADTVGRGGAGAREGLRAPRPGGDGLPRLARPRTATRWCRRARRRRR